MTQITIFGFMEGESTFFPVDIEETKTVAHLKEAVKLKMELKGPASKLEIYRLGDKQGITMEEAKV
jgi:hypothetical protein